MDAEKIAALRALCVNRTRGKWYWDDEHGCAWLDTCLENGSYILFTREEITKICGNKADKDYIVAACNALPGLLDEIERLQAEKDAAMRDMRGFTDCCTCKYSKKSFTESPCSDCDSENASPIKWEWRGLCSDNAPSGAESEKKNE